MRLIPESPICRSGLASLDDLACEELLAIRRLLEEQQQRFLLEEAAFRSTDYPWPRDALHNWSRIWEYPFVFAQLRRLAGNGDASASVMDFGSGVTFFPFAATSLGHRLVCVDVDPVVGRDLERAVLAHRVSASEVRFVATDGRSVPLPDASFDCIYSISVLEHIPDPAALVPELARLLRPKGMLILTIDVSIHGRNAEIQPRPHSILERALNAHFDLLLPERAIHPQRMLTSDNSPFPFAPALGFGIRSRLRRGALAALRETFFIDRGIRLACQAYVLERR